MLICALIAVYNLVSVPFGDIGSSNTLQTVIPISRAATRVSVPFGDIGSSNDVFLIFSDAKCLVFPSPSGISVLQMRYKKTSSLERRISVPFGDIGSSNPVLCDAVFMRQKMQFCGAKIFFCIFIACRGRKALFPRIFPVAAQKPAFLLSKILYRDFGWEGRSSHPADCTLKDTKISKVSGASSRSLTPIPSEALGSRRGFRS